MKTDPSKACPNEEQKFIWAFIHDFVSHPLMALTGWSALSLAFHDWTSHKAWPREMPVLAGSELEFISGVGKVIVYRFVHPKVNHHFVTTGTDKADAQRKANDWFIQLSIEFGGDFTL